MGQARVWNKNIFPYKEKFKGEEIYIPANGSIIMDLEDAINFKGSYSTIKVDGGNRPLPESYKKIVVEVIDPGQAVEISKLKCQACGVIATDKDNLDAHITEFHFHNLLDSDEIKRRSKK